ncbi:hypothetical protein FDN13_07390 [Caloramator sp. E03]|uniref:YmaF family protein n=1 Tax=Caloramator sp. E03 TaxID=2576307 RepID=UPI001110952B|nr:hypothetical protein FDN13_07390 [Caloramator sp. E03]
MRNCGYSCHVHRFSGCTTVCKCHSHYYNCISDTNENCRCHKHCLYGKTDSACGHCHEFKFLTCFDIPIWGGRHIHYYCGITKKEKGHRHYIMGYTLKDC